MRSFLAILAASVVILSVFLVPIIAEETETSDWTDEQFFSAFSEARSDMQEAFDVYQEILENYKPSSEKAKNQAKELKPLLVQYFRLLEDWEAACKAYGRKLIDDGMFLQSPKVTAVRNLGSAIRKARGKYSSSNLPVTVKDIDTILKRKWDVKLPVRELEVAEAVDTAETSAPKLNTGLKAGDRMVKTVDGVEFAFRWCPPGEFMMGSPKNEEGRESDETLHKVTLTKGFWMLETEVTQKQWQTIMGNNPSKFKGDNQPVEQVSWFDCQKFCMKCQTLGLPLQFPTEAQWEYACRAGATGAHSSDLDSMAWYDHKVMTTQPVGTKQPNTWGLYDMHGNVWEWCADWKSDYPQNAVIDPEGGVSSTIRVFRGGALWYPARTCRSAARCGDATMPFARHDDLGFRPILVPGTPSSKSSRETGLKAGDRMVKTVDGVEFAFRWCPPGEFEMGCTLESFQKAGITWKPYDATPHKVVLTKGFWMLETEITQQMWTSLKMENQSPERGDRIPVLNVNWEQCQDFCKRLTRKVGAKVELPTEAQWEYACRAGTTTEFGGNGNISDMGWCWHNGGKYHPVGEKNPNHWGLYDMNGNAWEWCLDWYEKDYYRRSPLNNPTGPENGTFHVRRGGSRVEDLRFSRCEYRENYEKRELDRCGFRIVINSDFK